MVKLILDNYPGLLYLLFMQIDHKWKPWRFPSVSNEFWQKKENQRDFLEDLAKNKNIVKTEDWYKIKKVREPNKKLTIGRYSHGKWFRIVSNI